MSSADYCVQPGWVYSASDGDRHYIGVGALVRLYALRRGQLHAFNKDTCPGRCSGTVVGPCRNGDYYNVNLVA